MCVAVLVCGACATQPLGVVIVDTRQDLRGREDPVDLVLDACAVWDLDCEPTIDQAGTVVITLTDGAGRIVGVEHRRGIGGQATTDLCSPRLWARDDVLTIAHELGHVLGLEHVSDADARNVMTPRVRADSDLITERQEQRVHLRVRTLALCPGRRPIIH